MSEQWSVVEPPELITKGARLRIKRGDEPDLTVIVDDVKREGQSWRLSVHPEDVLPADSELLRLYGGP